TATPVINELQEGVSLLEAIRQETIGIKTRANINSALAFFAVLRRSGVRYIPRYEQTEEKPVLSERRDDLYDDLTKVSDMLRIERVLLPSKLKQVKDKIQPGTVLYLEYVEGLLEATTAYVQSLGYSVGAYVGEKDSAERELVKKKFIAEEIDVLIGS